jgi:hypothetical protein
MNEWVTVSTVGLLLNRYHNNELPVSMTSSSTSTMCVHILPEVVPTTGYGSLTIFARTDEQLRDELLSLINQGYQFTVGSVRVTCSLHQLRLRESKATLIDCLLKRNPSTFEVEKVISAAGIALNYQIDKHPAVFGNALVPDDIHQKLRALQFEIDDREIATKYQSLNRYYNATKHAKTPSNRQDEETLAGTSGREIAIDYFETVRRIFLWYYKKYDAGVPAWNELEEIDYPAFGSSYQFSVLKRWP